MKDSHIGSYGILGLIIYYLLAYNLLVALPLAVTPFLLLSGDTWSKFISSNIINYLPYARKEEDSKSGTVYTRMNLGEIVMSAMGEYCLSYYFLQATGPCVYFLFWYSPLSAG